MRRTAPDAAAIRDAFAARVAHLDAERRRLDAELALTRHALDRLDGKPLDSTAIRRAYAARRVHTTTKRTPTA